MMMTDQNMKDSNKMDVWVSIELDMYNKNPDKSQRDTMRKDHRWDRKVDNNSWMVMNSRIPWMKPRNR